MTHSIHKPSSYWITAGLLTLFLLSFGIVAETQLAMHPDKQLPDGNEPGVNNAGSLDAPLLPADIRQTLLLLTGCRTDAQPRTSRPDKQATSFFRYY